MEWLTLTEAARYLKVSKSTLYRYCDEEKLKFFDLKSGGGRRFRQEDLDALLQPHQANVSKPS